MQTEDTSKPPQEEKKRIEGHKIVRPDAINYEEVQKTIDELAKSALKGDQSTSIDSILSHEKKYRLLEDSKATLICCKALLSISVTKKDWDALNEHVQMLCKRRSQLKQAIQGIVQYTIQQLDQIQDQNTQEQTIRTLLTVTDGKIFVELERARLTRRLCGMKEAEGKIDEAAEILQTLAVETFGTMHKREKIAFILEQVRLCLAKDDYVKAQILANKITSKSFIKSKQDKAEEEKKTTDDKMQIDQADKMTTPLVPEGVPQLMTLKLQYYYLMIQCHQHSGNYLETARAYRCIYDTYPELEDPSVAKEERMTVLKKVCWYVVLAPRHVQVKDGISTATDQGTLLHATYNEKVLEDLPLCRELLSTFVNSEIVRQKTLEKRHAKDIAELTDIFGGEKGASNLDQFRDRVTEHNVMVVAKYYSNVTLGRLAELLDLSEAKAEQYVSTLVVAQAIEGKMDRPAGIVRFRAKEGPRSVLNAWAKDLGKLLGLLEKSCQQISKDAMQHKIVLQGCDTE